MHLVQHFSRNLIPLHKNCCSWFSCSQPFAVRMANTVGVGVVQSRHFGWQPVLELTYEQARCPGSKWLLFVS